MCCSTCSIKCEVDYVSNVEDMSSEEGLLEGLLLVQCHCINSASVSKNDGNRVNVM